MFQEMNRVLVYLRSSVVLAFSIMIISSCASNRVEKQIKKGEVHATYYVWHTGVAPAGTGMNCRISFFNPSFDIRADSLIVNETSFKIETSQKGDSTIITGSYYVDPDFDDPNSTVPEFFLNVKYSGKVKLRNDQDSFWNIV